MDRFVDDGSLDDNVESFLSPDDADPRDRVGRSGEVGKGMINALLTLQCSLSSLHKKEGEGEDGI